MPLRVLVTAVLCLFLVGCPPPRGIYHTVQEGQNLYRIGKAYGVDEQYLARLNGISDPRKLPIGHKLFIPGADRIKSIPRETKTSAPQPPSVVTSVKKKMSAPVASAGSPSRTATAVLPAYKGKFAWPVKGEVVKKFKSGPGTPIKGIEIAATRGTPVLSAAAGKVIYSGNGISGYGNLIILKHADDFFTVYGFNQKNLVSAEVFVGKAERIALSGSPPGDPAPRLHFEIRHGKEAVDPIFYLP